MKRIAALTLSAQDKQGVGVYLNQRYYKLK